MSDRYILVNGEPVKEPDLMKWAKWFEGANDSRRVALDELGNVRVSTVFLGLDHSFGSGPPLLFETMVFGGELDETCERYSTLAEAKQGHADIVARIRGV